MTKENIVVKPETIQVIKKEFDNLKNNKENSLDRTPSNEVADNISDKIIDNANTYFLIKILSPEITKNEDKKREHKDSLINIVKTFLIVQFCILFALIFGVLAMIFVFHGLNNELSLDYIKEIIKFVSLYITSVVVELIAMLRYIVSNVFDTSITGLVEFYKDASNKEIQNENQPQKQEN